MAVHGPPGFGPADGWEKGGARHDAALTGRALPTSGALGTASARRRVLRRGPGCRGAVLMSLRVFFRVHRHLLPEKSVCLRHRLLELLREDLHLAQRRRRQAADGLFRRLLVKARCCSLLEVEVLPRDMRALLHLGEALGAREARLRDGEERVLAFALARVELADGLGLHQDVVQPARVLHVLPLLLGLLL